MTLAKSVINPLLAINFIMEEFVTSGNVLRPNGLNEEFGHDSTMRVIKVEIACIFKCFSADSGYKTVRFSEHLISEMMAW